MSGSQQAFTETWWGSRWIQALRRFGRGWPRSLADARNATQGIHDLNISPGCIEAVVPGENGESFQLRILLRTLPDATWQRILRRLAGKALYAAKLLSGEMPRDIERVFSQSRASLFPRRARKARRTSPALFSLSSCKSLTTLGSSHLCAASSPSKLF